MLTVMAIIYTDLRDLPNTRLELYQECVQVLIRRNIVIGYQVPEIDEMMPRPEFILGELAYGLHKDSEAQDSGIAELPRIEIQNRIAEIIIERRKVDGDDKRDAIRNEEVPRFCRFIDERTSILVDRGMARYGFVHQTFQEYFAAYYLNSISDFDRLWSEIKDKIWSQHWREVLLLLAEMLAQRVDALDALLDKTMAEAKAQEDSSHLLLLAEIVTQGTPVTDVFKSTVLRTLYEKCQKDGKFYSILLEEKDYVGILDKLRLQGLNEEMYNLLEKDIKNGSNEQRLWAVRYFSLQDDLIKSYIERFETSVAPYVNDSDIREALLPLLGDLKHLAAAILKLADIESIINPWLYPPLLPLYYRFLLEEEKFDEPSFVRTKLGIGLFAYSSSLVLFTLALALALFPNLYQIQEKSTVMINAEPLFHGAMIHTATLIEIYFKEGKELPSHLAYALEKPVDPENPYLRAAQFFRRFIKQKITPKRRANSSCF